jgi:predicted secreted protein
VLFLTLPFGVRSQHEDGEGAPGTDPGAPITAQMGRKMIWTTVISAVFLAVSWLAYDAGLLDVERLSRLMGLWVRAGPRRAGGQAIFMQDAVPIVRAWLCSNFETNG